MAGRAEVSTSRCGNNEGSKSMMRPVGVCFIACGEAFKGTLLVPEEYFDGDRLRVTKLRDRLTATNGVQFFPIDSNNKI
jgi:hypothetical protein